MNDRVTSWLAAASLLLSAPITRAGIIESSYSVFSFVLLLNFQGHKLEEIIVEQAYMHLPSSLRKKTHGYTGTLCITPTCMHCPSLQQYLELSFSIWFFVIYPPVFLQVAFSHSTLCFGKLSALISSLFILICTV